MIIACHGSRSGLSKGGVGQIQRSFDLCVGTVTGYGAGEIGDGRDRTLVVAGFAENMARHGAYLCDKCAYDPVADIKAEKNTEQGMLDVRRFKCIADGGRETTFEDVIILCATAGNILGKHRRENGEVRFGPTPDDVL